MMWRLTIVLASVLALQTFSSRALGVRVDVLVMDGGTPVAGLTARDFELRDNGVLQRVDVIEAVDVPINVVLALDTSASIRGRRLTDLIAAGNAILDGLKPVDRAAVVTFNHAVTPALPLSAELGDVRAALRTIDPGGRTSVMDGVYVALTSTVDRAGRFLLVVCTDGSDTMSWLTPPEVLEASKRANAVVYAVTAGGRRRSEPLKDLADATGGQMLQVKGSGDFRSAFQRILTEFRTRYVLAYSPEGVSPGGFHQLDIKVPRRRVVVKARGGYIGVASARHP
jgi:VWFA-related protein